MQSKIDYKVGDWVQRSGKPALGITPYGIYKVVSLRNQDKDVYVINDDNLEDGYFAEEFTLAKNTIIYNIIQEL